MRAYVGHVEYAGLRRFVAEDVLPVDVLQHLIRGWASVMATVVLAVLDEDAAEEICRELTACRPDAARGILLNRALDLIPLRPAVPNLSRSEPPSGMTWSRSCAATSRPPGSPRGCCSGRRSAGRNS